MAFSMWTYPWDVLDLSADTVERELRDAGLDTISLATSYHAGRFLQARSPRRKSYYPQDGTIYFEPAPSLWTDHAIRPLVAETVAEGDVLADLCARRGLRVACWTVCLHNTRLGLLHPGAVTRNAFGDPNYYSLCPSHPDARRYVTTLVADVSARYRPDAIELESPSFMGFAHGFHHEKDGVGLTAEGDFLLSLCFCDACLAGAATAGVDGERARRTVRRWIAEDCERAVPAPRWPEFHRAVFAPFPEVDDYVRWRFTPVTSLIRAIREAADPGTAVHVIDGQHGWTDGVDLSAVAGCCDGVILCCYDMTPDAVGRSVEQARATVGPGRYLAAGFRVFYPEVSGPADLLARAAAALRGGAGGLNFYNYGLIPRARLDWVREAMGATAGPPR